ncbi:MAG TPA: chemotaxis protein CheD [Spirochaetota bacterium]|nr:chemotaxis protein CheD [Spirochaetota bacterium]HOL57710.1 chemotaxis protein CheD [Spirochaetota bacterium]HPP05689.1 chemotaxis protein CheD [Spirochaetota bacterium]
MEGQEYFLNPGELIFSKKPIIVKTILGSCVAVCMHDNRLLYGGVCHYLLPVSPSDIHHSTKYGNVAIYTLIGKFIKNGSKKEDLIASIAGGAFIVFDEKEIFFIGDRNVEIAVDILKKEKIKIKQMWTGGDHGKRVLFNTGTNKIIVEILEKITLEDLYNPLK